VGGRVVFLKGKLREKREEEEKKEKERGFASASVGRTVYLVVKGGGAVREGKLPKLAKTKKMAQRGRKRGKRKSVWSKHSLTQ